MNSPSETPLWPLAVYFGAALLVVGFMLGLSYVLGQHHSEPATGEPYESGIRSTGTARIRFAARFYLMAMFFLIFDLESVFLFAWAVSAREAGWSGYIEALIFVGVLVVALIYLWRSGALDEGRESPLSGGGKLGKGGSPPGADHERTTGESLGLKGNDQLPSSIKFATKFSTKFLREGKVTGDAMVAHKS